MLSSAVERYLLFDASCTTCARMAVAVERATVRIVPRPLGDLDVQALVQRARPNWRWEPTLLEVDYGRTIRVSTGLRLRARLALLLGPRKAWELWRRVRRLGAPESRPDQRADARLLEDVATVLMSPVFAAMRPRLARQCPSDAWREAQSEGGVVVFNGSGAPGRETLIAFTVSSYGIAVTELIVEATEDGWRATNVGRGATLPTDATDTAELELVGG